jgi:hypothetical protein
MKAIYSKKRCELTIETDVIHPTRGLPYTFSTSHVGCLDEAARLLQKMGLWIELGEEE